MAKMQKIMKSVTLLVESTGVIPMNPAAITRRPINSRFLTRLPHKPAEAAVITSEFDTNGVSTINSSEIPHHNREPALESRIFERTFFSIFLSDIDLNRLRE